MSVEQMYQEIILDHYKAKHHSGLREPYEAEVNHVNPTCGDEIMLRVHLDGETIGDVSYDAVGCSISQASTSVMSDLVIGRTVDEALQVADAFSVMMHGRGTVVPDEEILEDGVAFSGVAQFPARVKCALLGWLAWKDAVAQALTTTTAEDSTMAEERAPARASRSPEADEQQTTAEERNTLAEERAPARASRSLEAEQATKEEA